MSSETDDYAPLSGLQHVLFCERQAALIHVERVWMENTATTLGKIVHERADTPGQDHRRGVRIVRAVPLRSDCLRLLGKADTVEFHRPASGEHEVPFPVEYKRGRAGHRIADQVQLCAQAICLEEQHHVKIRRGALFYDSSHRRVDVEFTLELRQTTEKAAKRLHDMIQLREVPPAVLSKKCGACSLEPICMPGVSAAPERASRYVAKLIKQATAVERDDCEPYQEYAVCNDRRGRPL